MTEPENPHGFACTRCGACCKSINAVDRVVFLTPDDVARISAYVGGDPNFAGVCFVDDAHIPDAPDALRVMKAAANGDCPFLGADNLCRVHLAKPHQCSHTPYRFLWGAFTFEYACTEGVVVPENWTSEREDAIFVSGLS